MENLKTSPVENKSGRTRGKGEKTIVEKLIETFLCERWEFRIPRPPIGVETEDPSL